MSTTVATFNPQPCQGPTSCASSYCCRDTAYTTQEVCATTASDTCCADLSNCFLTTCVQWSCPSTSTCGTASNRCQEAPNVVDGLTTLFIVMIALGVTVFVASVVGLVLCCVCCRKIQIGRALCREWRA